VIVGKPKKLWGKRIEKGAGGPNNFDFVFQLDVGRVGATPHPNIYNVLFCGH